jgi:rubredoxin
MKQWECIIYEYIHEGEEPSDRCPVYDALTELLRLQD